MRECGCFLRNMRCCCKGMWLFAKEYGVLLWGNVPLSQGIWCVVVRVCGCFPRNMVCCSEVCYALWIIEVSETIEYVKISKDSQLIRIDIVLFVFIWKLLYNSITFHIMIYKYFALPKWYSYTNVYKLHIIACLIKNSQT